MTHTSEPRRDRAWRALLSRKARAVLCLGIFAGPAAVGTMASWTDQAIIEPGGFTFGTLDLTVGSTVASSVNLVGTGGTSQYSTLTVSNLLPGESIARPFVVRNYGTTEFTYNGSIYTINDDLFIPNSGLKVAIYAGGEPEDTGTEADGNRRGTCPGGQLLSSESVSTATDTLNIAPVDIRLDPGATQSHCALIQLDATSPTTLQGRITQIVIKLDAQQVNGP